MVEWTGWNFDVFPGFQKFLAMRNITLYSVCYDSDSQAQFCQFQLCARHKKKVKIFSKNIVVSVLKKLHNISFMKLLFLIFAFNFGGLKIG